MRSDVIFNFIKEEWSSQRRMLLWYLLSSLIIELLVIFLSQQGWVLAQVKQHSGLDFGEFSMTAFALLFMPYAIGWMFLVNRPDRENRTGFYPFLHTLPITIREIVTAKYISAILMNGLMVGWLCGLWWVYELTFPRAASLTAWTALCMVVFFLAFGVLAVQLGFFFRGSSGLIFVYLVLLIMIGQFEFTDKIADQTMNWMDRSPLLLWGIVVLLTSLLWMICWRWSVKAYRKY
ncbi:ABC-2 transporter permease [Lentibacillus lipolyticus]|nr:ABC-2 transporter permease [Lentibacillus lipolyticus]